MTRDEKIAKARELRGHPFPPTIGMIAEQLGVSKTTIVRWTNPAYDKRSREMVRKRHRERTGVCVDCGGETKYGGQPGKPISDVCAECSRARQRASKKWTREAVIDAIQRFAAENGRPPTSTEWICANRIKNYPPRTACYRSGQKSSAPFEKWADAIEAAGFRRPRTGYYERTDPIMFAARAAENDGDDT